MLGTYTKFHNFWSSGTILSTNKQIVALWHSNRPIYIVGYSIYSGMIHHPTMKNERVENSPHHSPHHRTSNYWIAFIKKNDCRHGHSRPSTIRLWSRRKFERRFEFLKILPIISGVVWSDESYQLRDNNSNYSDSKSAKFNNYWSCSTCNSHHGLILASVLASALLGTTNGWFLGGPGP